MAAEVADRNNALSEDLRARLFYLSEFVGYQTRKALKGQGGVASLIEVNTAVMRGLTGQGGGE
ncbi:flagellar protein FlaF, putative [Oceanicola granulosus HTCC2516]|uniref:Flagellar protein FlaF, putative n=2 Tax=Oceanicola granulosus TaxID=252302 RepID=Q2CDG7_OCEGH|nr:flagellar protein FlaF, putative [Oceanicola granulosus HTCC2516]